MKEELYAGKVHLEDNFDSSITGVPSTPMHRRVEVLS